MKTLIAILAGLTIGAGYTYKDQSGSADNFILTLQEAGRILGEPCHLKESTDSLKNYGRKYTGTYLAKSSNDSKTVALYYMYENYNSENASKNTYTSIANANGSFPGFTKLEGLGDEAFFHSDNSNFCLLMARKGKILIRIKVNKLTPRTSTDELKKVARELLMRI